jgi:hypothetical protein
MGRGLASLLCVRGARHALLAPPTGSIKERPWFLPLHDLIWGSY